MKNTSRPFEFLNRIRVEHATSFLLFQTPPQMVIKGIRVRYADLWPYGVYLKTLLISIKIIHINLEYKCCFLVFNSKYNFQAHSEMIIKGIGMTYTDLFTLLSIFKGTVDMN